MDLINTATEDAVKKISLYEDYEDTVYGGYQKINKRNNPSVQRDEKKSTINDFDPPDEKERAKVRRTTKPLFIFKNQKMVLSLVDDPKKNNSYLKLSPLKKSTKISTETNYLDYLRADDDNLCLVNGIQAYLLASRFYVPNIDENTYCISPVRLKHEVYAQKKGWADQPFHQVDKEDEIQLNLNLQDLIGENTTPRQESASENRLTFPYTRTYLEVKYEPIYEEDGVTKRMDAWTCYATLEGDETKNPLPICSFIVSEKQQN